MASKVLIRHCVYGHLNALQLSISVQQRYSDAFKMHQIHLSAVAPPHMHTGELPTLSSRVGPRARTKELGGAAGQTFAAGATDPCAATGQQPVPKLQ